MLALKGLALLFLACLALIIVLGLLFLGVRGVYETFLSDGARTRKEKKQLEERIQEFEQMKKEFINAT